MSRGYSLKSLVFVLFAPLALTACANAFHAQYPICRQEPPDKGLTQYNDPLLQGAQQMRVSYLGAFEYVDYARFETPDLVLESVYDIATDVTVVLQYNYWMKRMTNTWNLNNGKVKSWGAKQTLTAWHGPVTYQPYQLSASGQSCIAFNSQWDDQPDDIQDRPTRVYFGYVCAKPGKQLAEAAAVKLISSVRLNPESGDRLVPVEARSSVDQAAFAAAHGTPGGSTGNIKFPFNFGTVYVEGDAPQRSTN